ncbi:MAG: agmatinase [Actinobacteria bacterium]|nr:agmatinase [Actinomycetota bacterium]
MLNNPNQTGNKTQGLFGLGSQLSDAQTVVLPVPWDVTASGKRGSAGAPGQILYRSSEIDIGNPIIPEFWETGIYMAPIDSDWQSKNQVLGQQVAAYIQGLEQGDHAIDESLTQAVDAQSDALAKWLGREMQILDEAKKSIIVLGGDHSISRGPISHVAQQTDALGVLQIDAHMDLRSAYQGFRSSHASVMYELITQIDHLSLVQVGGRDYCPEEDALRHAYPGRIFWHLDQGLAAEQFEGVSWAQQCEKMIAQLPQDVYVSIDIDGLSPQYAPQTGTPVPGGLTYQQVIYLLHKLLKSGRNIRGSDLVEVAGEKAGIDALVGAFLLFQLALVQYGSQQRLGLV